jgi:hypothetical protein
VLPHTQSISYRMSNVEVHLCSIFFYRVQKTSYSLRKRIWRFVPKRWYTSGNPKKVTSQKNAILSVVNKNCVNDSCIFSNIIASVTFLHPKLQRNTLCNSTISNNKMNLFYYSNLCCLLHVSKPRVHLQEDSCICSYGIVCSIYIYV